MTPADGKARLALGLMSGTSLDGIDAALLWTDGERLAEPGGFLSAPYESDLRERLRALLGSDPAAAERAPVEADLTRAHAEIIDLLLEKERITASKIKIIGFHGHTLFHAPDDRRTIQIGDGELLAAVIGRPVVNDFRSADMILGGQGAPLAPLYHRARAYTLGHPLAVLNIGGVANVTWLGPDDSDILAFDTGPGVALLDDWVSGEGRGRFDRDGALARAGRCNEKALRALMESAFFGRPPPKSLDRNDFRSDAVKGLGAADAAATLTAFTAAAVAAACAHLPAPPDRWLVTGGGRHNPAIMDQLRARLGAPVEPVESVGWRGDALEAEAFAYLAVRHLRGLPLSLPSTTGCREPAQGGRLWRPPAG